MNLFQILCFSLLVVLATFSSEATWSQSVDPQNKCDLKIELETKDSTPGKADGEVAISSIGGVSPYKYLFYEVNTGRQLQKDLSRSSVDGLKKGTYSCLVIDNNGCNKKVEFTIQ
jgi:hypothetical protein